MARVEVRAEEYKAAHAFLEETGVGGIIVGAEYNVKDSFSKVVGGVVRVISVEKAKISCILNVKPPTLSGHGVLLGAVVAAVAERVAIGCATTVIREHEQEQEHPHMCLGEITISYLSAAHPNDDYVRKAEVVVDASVIKSGRNLTVVAVDFRFKESQRLAYVSRVTLHNMPLSNLNLRS